MSINNDLRPYLLHTEEGAHTVFSPQFDATYHSKYGAIQEAQTVFIAAGLLAFAEAQTQHTPIRILEIGLGTGLNALMTFATARTHELAIDYTALEAYPLAPDLAAQLNFGAHIDFAEATDYLQKIHAAAWGERVSLSAAAHFCKLPTRFEDIAFDSAFDIIYYDAFAPSAQPELWTTEIFEKMYAALRPHGILTTYCAKGVVKRALRAAGFHVESLPGPRGKREMTRAHKR